MSGWLAVRWARTARPVLINENKPKGFRWNRRALKAGERRKDPRTQSALWYIGTGSVVPIAYLFYRWYAPHYKTTLWARRRAYEQILREDEEWAETRKEYGLDRFPRHVWHDNLNKMTVVDFPEVTYDPPWPGTGGEDTKEPSRLEMYTAAVKVYLNLK